MTIGKEYKIIIDKNKGITHALKKLIEQMPNSIISDEKITASEWDATLDKLVELNEKRKSEGNVSIFTGGTDLTSKDWHNNFVVHSKQEIIDSIYYLINSGVGYSKRYCAKEYEKCYDDMLSVSEDANALSILNNYVHPFNSFKSIIFNFDNDVIEITIDHTYSESDKKTINTKVDEIINTVITDNMAVREQIKAIHDYIIDNTEYDTLKSENIEDKTYQSNTAYGVLIEKFGICSGYSDTMKIFLDKLNIINYKISNDQHIWNLVYLDENWYHLDLTWDDPISDINITRDNYFLINTDTLEKLNDELHYFNYYTFIEAK